MEIEIISFGRIAEIVGSQKLAINNIDDTDGLKAYLEEKFPELKALKYKLALDRQLVQDNSRVYHNSVVAIMPPFSGG